MLHHYVYKITHQGSGCWYIGIRQSAKAPLEDTGYMGSGTVISELVAEFPGEWTKTILVQVQDRAEAARLERALVGPDQLEDDSCLNLCHGGSKGPAGAVRSEATKEKMRQATTRQMADPEKRAKWLAANAASHTDEVHAKISATLTGRKLGDAHSQRIGDANRGQVRTDEQRKNISDGNSRGWSDERRAKHAETMRARWAAGTHTGRRKKS